MDRNCGRFFNSNSPAKSLKLYRPITIHSKDSQFNMWSDLDLLLAPLISYTHLGFEDDQMWCVRWVYTEIYQFQWCRLFIRIGYYTNILISYFYYCKMEPNIQTKQNEVILFINDNRTLHITLVFAPFNQLFTMKATIIDPVEWYLYLISDNFEHHQHSINWYTNHGIECFLVGG